MNTLYPMKFSPIFKEKIWGGQKIRTSIGLDFSPLPNCGEAWVLSGIPGSETPVSNGFLQGNTLNELLEVYMDDLVGESVFSRHREEFPLLIKFIDSREWLSIQVHPDDELAAKRGLPGGKSEMWYVLEADPGAEIISGFSKPVSRENWPGLVKENRLTGVLNKEQVHAGNLFYIPAGRVHAMGPGILLAEIQQSSDTTYRIHDWNRTDEKGNSRELHTELALDAIDFTVKSGYRSTYLDEPGGSAALVHTPHFNVNLVRFSDPVLKEYGFFDSFVIHLCTEGAYRIEYEGGSEKVTRGEALLIPALMEDIRLIPERSAALLEIYMP